MKTLLFASAFAVAALASAPAFAQTTGFAGAAVSRAELETPFGNTDGESYSAGGSVYLPTSEALGFQLDLSASDADDAEATINGAAHVVTAMSKGRIGGFVAASTTDGDTLWGVGAEGQVYVDEQITLAGVLAYAKEDEADIEVVGAGGQGRFFATDNFRIDANIGYLDVQDVDVSIWVAGVGAEYQFAKVPVSVFGGYSRIGAEDVDVTADIFSLGVRYNFGGASLKQRDRSGAAMLGLDALANGLVF